MKKRIFAVILVLVMILPLVIACKPTDDPVKDTEKETQAATDPSTGGSAEATDPVDTAPETDAYGRPAFDMNYLGGLDFGETIVILAGDDYVMQEFEGTGDKGEEIDTAIYRRNEAVERKLGVTLKFIPTPCSSDKEGYVKKVGLDIESPDKAEYDIYAGYSRAIPQLASLGYTEDLNTLDYLDFSAPWWPSKLVEEATILGQLHFCSGDISSNLTWLTNAVFFNKDLVEEYQLESPYACVENNTWTLEKLKALSVNIWEDLDGSGGKSEGDVFGLITHTASIDAMSLSGNFTSVVHDKGGKLILNDEWGGEDMIECMEFINEWYKTSSSFFYSDSYSGTREMFNQGQGVFFIERFFATAGKQNTSADEQGFPIEFGVVPVPKFKAEDDYRTQLGHPFTLYAISRKTELKNESAATLELMAAEGYRYVTPAIFYVALQVKYSDDPTASAMYDLIRSSVTFEIGRIYCDVIGTSASSLFRTTSLGTSVSTTPFKMAKGNINNKITEINTIFSERN